MRIAVKLIAWAIWRWRAFVGAVGVNIQQREAASQPSDDRIAWEYCFLARSENLADGFRRHQIDSRRVLRELAVAAEHGGRAEFIDPVSPVIWTARDRAWLADLDRTFKDLETINERV